MFSKVLSLSCVGGTLDSGWGQIFSFYKEAGGAGGAEGAPWPSHGHSTHRRKEVQTPWGPGVTWRREAVVPGPKGHTLRLEEAPPHSSSLAPRLPPTPPPALLPPPADTFLLPGEWAP